MCSLRLVNLFPNASVPVFVALPRFPRPDAYQTRVMTLGLFGPRRPVRYYRGHTRDYLRRRPGTYVRRRRARRLVVGGA